MKSENIELETKICEENEIVILETIDVSYTPHEPGRH